MINLDPREALGPGMESWGCASSLLSTPFHKAQKISPPFRVDSGVTGKLRVGC